MFYNLKPVKLHVACIAEQNVTQDRTMDKETKAKFNNKLRYPHTSENNLATIRNIETAITSRSPHSYKENREKEVSFTEATHPL